MVFDQTQDSTVVFVNQCNVCKRFSPQGLGLYAARDIEKHTMVIEYIGTIIRNEVANRKEKLYESQVGSGPCDCVD